MTELEDLNPNNLELGRAVTKAIKICEGLNQDNRYRLIEVLAAMYHDDLAWRYKNAENH